MSCCLRVWLLIRRHLSDDCGLSQSLNGLVGTSPLPGALVHPNNEAKCPVSPWKMLVYIPSILTFTAATWGAALQASQLTINSACMCKSRRTTTNKETGVKRVWECAHTHTHTHTPCSSTHGLSAKGAGQSGHLPVPPRKEEERNFLHYSLRVQPLTNLHHQKKANHNHNKISPHTWLPQGLQCGKPRFNPWVRKIS